MEILTLSARVSRYLERRNLLQVFEKQRKLFEVNPLHPSLNTEILHPKHLRIYSFRITRAYRAIFIYVGSNSVKIIDINNHYQ